MALSVYHNNEDLWKIPRMIAELCPGCRFYLRYHGGNLWPTEISFLAVPKRIIKQRRSRGAYPRLRLARHQGGDVLLTIDPENWK